MGQRWNGARRQGAFVLPRHAVHAAIAQRPAAGAPRQAGTGNTPVGLPARVRAPRGRRGGAAAQRLRLCNGPGFPGRGTGFACGTGHRAQPML
ncbi:hypothetical protein CBM2587_B90590 [Cupriavidus taiwanensis]|uniref:Uncharacterized protein n=1 Tax=Cupriavidus taiwanensis TaxID=164546 RepID=A0A375CE14_9BURK|nr:hypothetical protein CBM2587_B90590 [Cupriavidus taiwanensis]